MPNGLVRSRISLHGALDDAKREELDRLLDRLERVATATGRC